MKKLILIMFFAFAGMAAFAKSPKIQSPKIRVVQVLQLCDIPQKSEVIINNAPITFDVSACGRTGTFTWNYTNMEEYIQLVISIVNVYCGTGSCA